MVNGIPTPVGTARISFKQWSGVPIGNTFGGKPLLDVDGKPMFAELAIQRQAKQDGWQACWVETYAMKNKQPYYFNEWLDGPITAQLPISIDQAQVDLLARIAECNGGSFYGCWDVLAWKDSRSVFMESKRTKKDAIRSTQLKWLEAGLAAGLSLDQFLIVQWDAVI